MSTLVCTQRNTKLIDGIYYHLNEPQAGEASVTNNNGGKGNSNYTGVIRIPETVTYTEATYTVTTIGSSAFKGSEITSITIPKTITAFEDQALFNCNSLTEIICYSIDPPTLGAHPFKNMTIEDITLTVPGQSIEDYSSADY